jgi:predicted alpha/beta-fold hydrolase
VLNRHGGHLGFLDMRVGGLRSRVDDAVALWAKEILGPPPYCTSTNCQRQTP